MRHSLPAPGRTSPSLRVLAVVLASGVLLAACGSTGSASSTPSPTSAGSPGACVTAPEPGELPDWGGAAGGKTVIPQIVSTEQVCGPNRFLFSLIGPDNRPVAAPDRTAKVALYNLGRDPAKPVATADGRFIWAIKDVAGLYVANVDFAEAGEWGAEFTTGAPGAATETIRVRFEVHEKGSTPGVGSRAPASKTLTLADVSGDVRRLSTDQNPNKDFYQLSVDQALAQHQPFVLVFATPAFCQTRTCGPTLDIVKSVAKQEPGVTFINVEPYRLEFVDGRLQPVLDANGQLQPVQAVNDWGLLTEPFTFVVDRGGIVRASFEGVLSPDELKPAIDAIR